MIEQKVLAEIFSREERLSSHSDEFDSGNGDCGGDPLVIELNRLAAVFDERPLTARKINIYRFIFSNADASLFRRACTVALKTCRNFPKPAELIDIMEMLNTKSEPLHLLTVSGDSFPGGI